MSLTSIRRRASLLPLAGASALLAVAKKIHPIGGSVHIRLARDQVKHAVGRAKDR